MLISVIVNCYRYKYDRGHREIAVTLLRTTEGDCVIDLMQ